MTVRIDGKRFITPLAIALIAIGTADVIFAVDSIPAIFGLTQETLPGLRGQRVLAAGPAAAVLPHRRPARPAGLPVLRAGRDPRLHRGQAGHPRPAHQRAAASSTAASTSRVIPEIPTWLSLAVILGHPGGDDGGQPRQEPARPAPSRSPRTSAPRTSTPPATGRRARGPRRPAPCRPRRRARDAVVPLIAAARHRRRSRWPGARAPPHAPHPSDRLWPPSSGAGHRP